MCRHRQLTTIKSCSGVLAGLVVLYLFIYALSVSEQPAEEGLALQLVENDTVMPPMGASIDTAPTTDSELPSPTPSPPPRRKLPRSKLDALDCQAMLDGNASYLARYVRGKRLTLPALAQLANPDMGCDAIKSRWSWNFLHHNSSSSSESDEEHRQFPLAFARTVFRDYPFVEQMLSVEYTPWNYYCYALDAKASGKFKAQMRALANCFPNVVVAKPEYSVFSNGKNVSRSHLACLEELLGVGADWKYALLLQNHDLPYRTNWDAVRVLREFGAANDIATNRMRPDRVKAKLDWTPKGLHLYRNAKKNEQLKTLNGNGRLVHTKSLSLNLVALSRPAVEFVSRELNLSIFINQLERGKYGMDEALFSTLNSNLPDFPGGYTAQCLLKFKKGANNIGRYVLWRYDGVPGAAEKACRTRKFRHSVCIFGAEDLHRLQSSRATIPHLYVNKMLPEFDYGAAYCWLKTMAEARERERTSSSLLDLNYYRNLPHVRYNRLRSGAKAGSKLEFNCEERG